MFFYWLFCTIVAGAAWASNTDGSYEKAYLNFHNNTLDDVSIRIEKACAPVVSTSDKNFILLKESSNLKIEYDVSVTNCLVVAPYDKEFGSDISLFVLDLAQKNIDSRLGFSVESCDVNISYRDQSYHLSSDCLAIKKV